ncbi:hypothetical protein H009_03924 [Agrobacterium tumefaciens str. Cherry 2E-2-2]|nr:hypothetical protein H009_03924 [Agrobacterium tumefaciens str. Cherry 2E-2-2]
MLKTEHRGLARRQTLIGQDAPFGFQSPARKITTGITHVAPQETAGTRFPDFPVSVRRRAKDLLFYDLRPPPEIESAADASFLR